MPAPQTTPHPFRPGTEFLRRLAAATEHEYER